MPTYETVSGRLRLKVDWRDETPGYKYNHWEMRGVPFRLELGPRDVASEQAMLVRRLDRAKEPLPLASLAEELPKRLAAYQTEMFERARDFQTENTHSVDTLGEMTEVLDGPGWLPAGAMVRLHRVREGGLLGERRHHPGDPLRLARRGWSLRRRRCPE